MLIFWNFDK